MFGFMRRSAVRTPSAAILRAIEADGPPPPTRDGSALRVVESRGKYSGRGVTYIRVFDPSSVAERAVDVRAYRDLDLHPDLVLRTGHVEQDGRVVITWRAPSADAAAPTRELADRAAHGDDEQLVFRDKDR